MLYKGYVETHNKIPIESLKGRRKFKTYEEVKDCQSFAGVLANDVILVDVDDKDMSEMLMKVVEDKQLNCKVVMTTRGRHFLFKNTNIKRNKTHTALAMGITSDIKLGCKTSIEALKVDGEERFVEWDIEEGESYDELPKWLYPIKSTVDFVGMEAGDGRNQALFNYILTLQSNDFSVDETREAIRILNQYVLQDPLTEDELDVILRDEAFQKPIFFKDNTFLFDAFATYIKNHEHVIKINGQLHIYRDGIYLVGYRHIEESMIQLIPNLKKTQRREVLEYLELIAEPKTPADARYIGFQNGILDMTTNDMLPFSPELILINKIPWNYEPEAYNKLADQTLNNISCQDKDIRALLEECIGYCFYRRNELGKAFILTGGKANGKSTFLDCVKTILGEDNISALDLKELGDRFSTSMMFGKLANIGDDIGDDFLQGSQVATFKKVVTGNRIKAEQKGKDPFEFNPYIKLLFSANDIPRMRDKTGAVLRRLMIIPFNAKFSSSDPDYDPYIKYKLVQQDSIEYMIRLGVEGLKRVLESPEKEFTKSSRVAQQIEEYEIENDPVKGFLLDQGENMIENELTSDVYARYQLYCAENMMQPLSKIVFSKQICRKLGLETIVTSIDGKSYRMFRRV